MDMSPTTKVVGEQLILNADPVSNCSAGKLSRLPYCIMKDVDPCLCLNGLTRPNRCTRVGDSVAWSLSVGAGLEQLQHAMQQGVALKVSSGASGGN